MPEIDVNAMIWGIFRSASLGRDYQDNSRTTKNTDFKKVKQIVRYFTEFAAGPKSRNIWDVYMLLEHSSTDENYFVERQSRQAVEGKGMRFFLFRYFVLAELMNIHDQ